MKAGGGKQKMGSCSSTPSGSIRPELDRVAAKRAAAAAAARAARERRAADEVKESAQWRADEEKKLRTLAASELANGGESAIALALLDKLRSAMLKTASKSGVEYLEFAFSKFSYDISYTDENNVAVFDFGDVRMLQRIRRGENGNVLDIVARTLLAEDGIVLAVAGERWSLRLV